MSKNQNSPFDMLFDKAKEALEYIKYIPEAIERIDIMKSATKVIFESQKYVSNLKNDNIHLQDILDSAKTSCVNLSNKFVNLSEEAKAKAQNSIIEGLKKLSKDDLGLPKDLVKQAQNLLHRMGISPKDEPAKSNIKKAKTVKAKKSTAKKTAPKKTATKAKKTTVKKTAKSKAEATKTEANPTEIA